MRARTLAIAYFLDWVLGDPEGWPHPVRAFGSTIRHVEETVRRPEDSPSLQLLSGSGLAVGLPLSSGFLAQELLRCFSRYSTGASEIAEVILASTCLATKSLLKEANTVLTAVESGDLSLARRRLSRIVGRDTESLDASEICRATIETLAESLSDGIISPLFYLALGGVPASLAFKSISTMDSMIGHRDEKYFYFGKTAARLDDVANFLPARLSALFVCTSAIFFSESSVSNALRIWLRDRNRHKSPNAGQPESAMAGALETRLGGRNLYDGDEILSPVLGAEFPQASLRKAKTAVKITAVASLLGCTVALLYLWGRKR